MDCANTTQQMMPVTTTVEGYYPDPLNRWYGVEAVPVEDGTAVDRPARFGLILLDEGEADETVADSPSEMVGRQRGSPR